MTKRYRPNVAVVVVNPLGQILACHRTDVAGAWQLPQGGIEDGETPEEALFRELEEEIGTRKVTIIGRLPETICYDWPEHLYRRGFHGQEQHYFLTRLNSDDTPDFDSIRTKEFDKFEWLDCAKFLEKVAGFKAEPYKLALAKLRKLFPDVIAD